MPKVECGRFQWQGRLKSQVMHRHIVMHANAGNDR